LSCDYYGNGFSLCYKCYGHRSIAHNSEHEFDEIGPLYEGHDTSPELSAGEYQSDNGDESDDVLQKESGFQGTSDVQGSDNAAGSSQAGSDNIEDSGFGNDSGDGGD
jgi:hypothetical protein